MAGPIRIGDPHDLSFSSPWLRRRESRAEARQGAALPGIFHDPEFHRRLGKHAAEFRSLSQEQNSEIFYEGLLQLGQRLEADGREEAAASIYQAIVGAPFMAPAGTGSINRAPTDVLQSAQGRLAALDGKGSLSAQAELFLRRLPGQGFQAPMLVGFTAATVAAKVFRLAALSRLSLSPSVNFMTRGFGARATAGFLSFVGEAAVLPLATRTGALVLGEELNWDLGTLGREAWGSALFLGGMRLVRLGMKGLSVGAGLVPARSARTMLVASGQGRALPLPGLLRQVGVLGGIALGQEFEAMAGLRKATEGAGRFFDVLNTYGHLVASGSLARGLLGNGFARWEQSMDAYAEALGRTGRVETPPSMRRELAFSQNIGTGFAKTGSGENVPPLAKMPQVLAMASEGLGSAAPTSHLLALPSPKMGLLPPGKAPNVETRPWCLQAEALLKQLTPNGQVQAERVAEDGYVQALLSCYGVTCHPLDLASFRRGWEIAQTIPERVRRTAFDVDEVYLHWGLSFGDLFRGIFARGADPPYENTHPVFFEYQPFKSTARLSRLEEIWYRNIQKFLKCRMRQHLQFHPGMRAFQLGLRLGQDRNLIMVTTGPAGRIMVLANEDPAMRMIYFGKGPQRMVTAQEVRDFPNIYTREHLALAMRTIVQGMNFYHEHPLVRDYIERIQRDPARAVKFKHPALEILLKKQAFSILVDDSASTYEMLGELPNFAVLRTPSARPKRTLNFVPGSVERYLCRMSNACVTDLAERLGSADRLASQILPPPASTPADYPHQRLVIEIPWLRFEREFVQPARELAVNARRVSVIDLGDSPGPVSDSTRRKMARQRLQGVTERLQNKLNVWITGTGAQAAVEFELTGPLEEMARGTPEAFEEFLRLHLTEREINLLPENGMRLALKSEDCFSRVASLIAAKRAALTLLNLEWGSHARELDFRFGVAAASGELREILGDRVLMLSMTRSMLNLTLNESAGVGVALLEAEPGQSRLAGIGIDTRMDLVGDRSDTRLALTEAVRKAVFQAYPPGEPKGFDPRREKDLKHRGKADYALKGRLAELARALSGAASSPEPLPIRVLHFHASPEVFGLVGIPTPLRTTPPPPSATPPPTPEPPPGASPPRSAGSAASSRRVEVSPVIEVYSTSAAEPPYVKLPDGTYDLPHEGMDVVILGDVAGKETFRKALQGHRVTHIDWDPEVILATEDLVSLYEESARQRGKLNGHPLSISFVNDNWFTTTVQADRVEAFYPLDRPDVSARGDPKRDTDLRAFVRHAMLTKLKPGGAGFVVTEDYRLIEDLAEVIRREPGLELAETAFERSKPPIFGGYGVIRESSIRHSWLIFAFQPPQK